MWWKKEIASGEQQIKKKKITTYKKAHDLLADLHAGK